MIQKLNSVLTIFKFNFHVVSTVFTATSIQVEFVSHVPKHNKFVSHFVLVNFPIKSSYFHISKTVCLLRYNVFTIRCNK